MKYVRVSTLDLYRKILQKDYVKEDDLVETLRRGQFLNNADHNEWSQAGMDWHEAMGMNWHDAGELVLCGSTTFRKDDIISAQMHAGDGLRELKGSALFYCHAVKVRLCGTCDHLYGNMIRDYKCKFSKLEVVDYEPSLQWRAYLHIFGCSRFVYDFFVMDIDKDKVCRLKEVNSVGFWHYDRLEQDLAEWIGDFLAWAESKGLSEYLKTPPL